MLKNGRIFYNLLEDMIKKNCKNTSTISKILFSRTTYFVVTPFFLQTYQYIREISHIKIRFAYYFVFGGFIFVCLFIVPLENLITYMETSPLPVKVFKCSPMLGTHGHWAVPHPLWHGGLLILVISEDPWHLHLLWSCHYLFLRLRSVVAGIQTPNLLLAEPTL